MVRERLAAMVEGVPGARVVGHAAQACEAVSAILASQADLVVLDLRLADGSGFDVLRALHEAAPAIEVYMLSNFATEPYRRLAARLGARGFFDKSSEFERVRDVVAARAAHTS